MQLRTMSTAKHRGSTGSNCVTREVANVSENVKIYWIAEYNDLTWECNQLGSFPPSSLETECENLSFFGYLENVHNKSVNHFNLRPT